MGVSFPECHTKFRQVEIRGLATDALEVHGVVRMEVKTTAFFQPRQNSVWVVSRSPGQGS